MSSNINEYLIDYNLISKLDIEYMKENVLLPLKEEEFFITIASNNMELNQEEIVDKLNKPIKIKLYPKNEILQKLHLFKQKHQMYTISYNATKYNTSEDSNIEEFLNILIKNALNLKASDIHIESAAENFQIRFRIDGVLKHIITLQKEFLNILSSYIKLKSNLDISLKRLPQDSRFSSFIKDEKYDFRISTMPTIEGESIVIRILENNLETKRLENIGFSENTLSQIKQKINLSSGLILITGPTGSGKTTTLYSIIKEINHTAKKIVTIEDPIEYKIPKVQQIAINKEIGLTFQKILTNILRQDPDIILIGEIRDKESLKIAIQASLTGHLVFATLHTNSALNTINRIIDLDGEPFLLASTLKTIISQRLVRKLCNICKKYDEETKSYLPIGCDECNFDGYKDRVILYEMLNIDEKLASMIEKNATMEEIQKYLQQNNYINIHEYSNYILDNGDSSKEEIYKAINI